MAESIKLLEYDFECLCGNNSHGQGAYPSDREGREIEMPPSEDDPVCWCCDRCGRIWDGQTGEVVARRKESE